jgi:hypothetical protein
VTATITNRQRLADAIEAHGSKLLKEEIAYIMEAWADDPDCQSEGFDIADAFNHVQDVAEDNNDRAVVRSCNAVLIACGYLSPRKPGTQIYGRDRAPVINGQRHDVARAWCLWIKE